MVDFKVVVSDPKSGRAYNVDASGGAAGAIVGKRIGDEVDGGTLGLAGYKIRITGASDRTGTAAKQGIRCCTGIVQIQWSAVMVSIPSPISHLSPFRLTDETRKPVRTKGRTGPAIAFTKDSMPPSSGYQNTAWWVYPSVSMPIADFIMSSTGGRGILPSTQ